jgi:hypothetical protein
MDLKHLHYFIIAAEEGHITKVTGTAGVVPGGEKIGCIRTGLVNALS